MKYNDGYPNERGLYKCKVDGKVTYLIHHVCMNNGKHWWSDTAGRDVIADKIQYIGEKLKAQDI